MRRTADDRWPSRRDPATYARTEGHDGRRRLALPARTNAGSALAKVTRNNQRSNVNRLRDLRFLLQVTEKTDDDGAGLYDPELTARLI